MSVWLIPRTTPAGLRAVDQLPTPRAQPDWRFTALTQRSGGLPTQEVVILAEIRSLEELQIN
jgi:hypothetical protein